MKYLEYIDNKIAEYEAALDEDMPLEKKVIIKDKIADQHQKKEKYEQLNKALSSTEDGQISTTDPDSRGVVFQRTSVKIGYNIQAASDDKHKLLVAFDTGDVNDTHQLANMTAKAMQNTQSEACTVLADKGYHTGVQLEQCEQMNAIPFVAPKASSASVVHGVYSVEEFKYCKQKDTYTCPANEILTSNGTVYTRKSRKKNAHDITFKHYTTKACKTCTLKNKCTSRNAGRIVQRSQHQDAIDRNNKRIENNPNYYRQRQQIIEHQFGTLKRQWHIDYTLVKTKEKVLTEIAIAFTVYNLRRTMSIFSPKALIKALKSLKNAFFNFLSTRITITTHKMKITSSIFTKNDVNLKYINYI